MVPGEGNPAMAGPCSRKVRTTWVHNASGLGAGMLSLVRFALASSLS